jgi:hypothetical protein
LFSSPHKKSSSSSCQFSYNKGDGTLFKEPDDGNSSQSGGLTSHQEIMTFLGDETFPLESEGILIGPLLPKLAMLFEGYSESNPKSKELLKSSMEVGSVAYSLSAAAAAADTATTTTEQTSTTTQSASPSTAKARKPQAAPVFSLVPQSLFHTILMQ